MHIELKQTIENLFPAFLEIQDTELRTKSETASAAGGNAVQHLTKHLDQLSAAVTHFVKSAAFDQVFHGALVQLRAVHPLAEILQ